MPLMPGKSKKAFSKNVKTEMEAGKPQPQALAIAYSVKRKHPKKMAEGGSVSAKTEKRPMPDSAYDDAAMVKRNSGDKPAKEDSWTDSPTIKQAQKPSITRLSQPRMVGSDAYSTRIHSLKDDEADFMDKDAPASPKEQPKKRYDEMDATKSGPKVSDMAAEHSNHRAPYKEEVEHDDEKDEAESDMKMYAKGGHVALEFGSGPEEDRDEHPADLEEDDDQMSPAESEYMSDRFAEGGAIEEEAEEENHSSIAAAIMSRQRRLAQDSGSRDEDMAEHDEMPHFPEGDRHYARGGRILSEDSMETHEDADQADLARNAEEDANMEDKASFDALRKENYSESDGLEDLTSPMDSNEHGHEMEDEDSHDMVSMIRRKYAKKSPISR